MEKVKFTQISVSALMDEGGSYCGSLFVALDDQGRVWEKEKMGDGEWVQVESPNAPTPDAIRNETFHTSELVGKKGSVNEESAQ